MEDKSEEKTVEKTQAMGAAEQSIGQKRRQKSGIQDERREDGMFYKKSEISISSEHQQNEKETIRSGLHTLRRIARTLQHRRYLVPSCTSRLVHWALGFTDHGAHARYGALVLRRHDVPDGDLEMVRPELGHRLQHGVVSRSNFFRVLHHLPYLMGVMLKMAEERPLFGRHVLEHPLHEGLASEVVFDAKQRVKDMEGGGLTC